jgi:hypothetical protein
MSRRAWITLGEVIAVLGLAVAILSLWDSHQERAREDRERAAAARQAAGAAVFTLRAEVEADGQRLRIAPVHDDAVIQSQTLVFPAKVRADPVRTTGDARIEAGWIEAGLRKVAPKTGHGDGGDLSVPVGVATTYLVDGQTLTDQSIYLVGYTLKPRLLLGAKVELQGLSLARRGVAGDLRAKVEAMAP